MNAVDMCPFEAAASLIKIGENSLGFSHCRFRVEEQEAGASQGRDAHTIQLSSHSSCRQWKRVQIHRCFHGGISNSMGSNSSNTSIKWKKKRRKEGREGPGVTEQMNGVHCKFMEKGENFHSKCVSAQLWVRRWVRLSFTKKFRASELVTSSGSHSSIISLSSVTLALSLYI